MSVTTVSSLGDDVPAFEYHDDEADSRVLALDVPGNCQLVVVTGDLEEFARRVYTAVFGAVSDSDEPDGRPSAGEPADAAESS